MGYNSPDGTGLTVEMLRRLAHFLILQASGELEQLPEPQHFKPEIIPQQSSTPGKRKRQLRNDDTSLMESMVEKEPAVKKIKKIDSNTTDKMTASPAPRSTRATRKSLAPEMLRNLTPKKEYSKEIDESSLEEEKVACRLKASSRKSIVTQTTEETEGSDINEIELNLGPNPTPQMIARKRRSLAITSKSSNTTPSKAAPFIKETTSGKLQGATKAPVLTNGLKTIMKEEKEHKVNHSQPQSCIQDDSSSPRQPCHSPRGPLPPSVGYPGSGNNEIYLAQCDTSSLKYEDIKKQIRDFAGANLTVLHTPHNWGALEVFSLVMSIRQMNRKANVTTFR